MSSFLSRANILYLIYHLQGQVSTCIFYSFLLAFILHPVFLDILLGTETGFLFENSAENRTPAYIIFGVKYDVNILLLKAKYLTEVEVFPVPHGAWVGTEGQIQVSSEELKNYINEKTVMLSDSQLQQTENNTNTDNNTEEQNG